MENKRSRKWDCNENSTLVEIHKAWTADLTSKC